MIPRQSTPKNLETAESAIELFKEYLESKPSDIPTMKMIASVYYNVNKAIDAIDWQKKILSLDPHDYEAAYTIGVIDWEFAHHHTLELLNQIDLNDDGRGNLNASHKVLQLIKAENTRPVEEALTYLNLAIQNNPKYEDAMVYLGLVYRRKADIDWDDKRMLKADLAQADEWMSKAFELHKAAVVKSSEPETKK